MTLTSVWLTVDGMPATEIAPHSPPVWETWADGGCGSLTWDFAMSPKQMHRKLRPGALVEARVGMHPVFSGRMSEPDRTTWQCIAYGHAAHARKLPALDPVGAAVRNVAVASAKAQTWGWVAEFPYSESVGDVAGEDTGVTMLGALFDQWATDAGQRWGVDARRQVYRRLDPTAPTLDLAPGVAALGQSDEDMASHVGARFVNVGGTISTTIRPDVTSTTLIESMQMVDLTDRGPLPLDEANTALDGILALGKSRPAWTSGMTVHRSQLQHRGVSPFLPLIRAGETMVRLTGIPTAWVQQGMNLNVVIGKTRFDAATPDQIYLEPAGTVPRNLVDVIAAA